MKEPAAIEHLRRMVRYFSYQNETFNHRHTFDQLLKIASFAFSEQGEHVHECADSWPDFLLASVLAAPLGAPIDAEIVKRAGELC